MKKAIWFFLILIIIGCKEHQQGASNSIRCLRVYYAEPYFSNSIWDDFRYFEARYDCKVEMTNFIEPGRILDLLKDNDDTLRADVVCSIPGAFICEISDLDVIRKMEIENRKLISGKFTEVEEGYFTPYAQSFLGFASDGSYITEPPYNFGSLQDNRWNETVIIPDPVSSGIGRSLLHLTAGRYGKNGFRYLWDGIQKNFLFYSAGFEEGYRSFLAGEGHLIPAMITLNRYHSQQTESKHIHTFLMEEGTYRLEEYAAVVNGSDKISLAHKFIEFLLEKEFQRRIWTEKWMYPVNNELIEELDVSEEIAIYDAKSSNPSRKIIQKEEELWLRKLNRTLKR